MAPTDEIPLTEAVRLCTEGYPRLYRLCRDGVIASRKDATGQVVLSVPSLYDFLLTQQAERRNTAGLAGALGDMGFEALARVAEERGDDDFAARCRYVGARAQRTVYSVDLEKGVAVMELDGQRRELSLAELHQRNLAAAVAQATPPLADMPTPRAGVVS